MRIQALREVMGIHAGSLQSIFLKIPDLQFSKPSQAENCPEKY